MWPCQNNKELFDIPDIKPILIVSTAATLSFDVFKAFSSLTKLLNVVAYCLRFSNNLKKDTIKFTGPLTLDEIENSKIVLLQLMQAEGFPRELNSLKNSKAVSSNSKLADLNPFIESEGLIRVDGRLNKSGLAF